MENDWILVRDRMPPFVHNEDVRGGEKATDIVEVKYSDDTTGQGLYRDNPYRCSWMTRRENVGFLHNMAWSGITVVAWRPLDPPQLPAAVRECCPFDKTPLVNVGALKEFEDGKDNHVCPSCRRIWVDVTQEEWWTRQARVEIVGELSEGSNYVDAVKVIQ